MANGFVGLLLVVLITGCVLSSFSNAMGSSKLDQCPRVRHKRNCTDKDDLEITKCCLKEYKLGFDNSPSNYDDSVEDPPSCALDVALAKCLDDSNCFRKPLTRNLRLLMFNQLIFTKRTGLCSRIKFEDLLRETKKRSGTDFLKSLVAIEEMNRFDHDACAEKVYKYCGKNFSQSLKENPGYDIRKLCEVFQKESTCTYTEAVNNDCTKSRLLNRFKENSLAAAPLVLNAICT